jgi:hypothetical protein
MKRNPMQIFQTKVSLLKLFARTKILWLFVSIQCGQSEVRRVAAAHEMAAAVVSFSQAIVLLFNAQKHDRPGTEYHWIDTQ